MIHKVSPVDNEEARRVFYNQCISYERPSRFINGLLHNKSSYECILGNMCDQSTNVHKICFISSTLVTLKTTYSLILVLI